MAMIQLSLPLCDIAIAFDASLVAGAVVHTTIDEKYASNLWNEALTSRYSFNSERDEAYDVPNIIE